MHTSCTKNVGPAEEEGMIIFLHREIAGDDRSVRAGYLFAGGVEERDRRPGEGGRAEHGSTDQQRLREADELVRVGCHSDSGSWSFACSRDRGIPGNQRPRRIRQQGCPLRDLLQRAQRFGADFDSDCLRIRAGY